MLKKDQLLKDREFKKVLLEEILIYKEFTDKRGFDNRLAIALIVGGYCNKEIKDIYVQVRPIKKYGIIEYYCLTIQERLNSKWMHTKINIMPDTIDEWVEEMNT